VTAPPAHDSISHAKNYREQTKAKLTQRTASALIWIKALQNNLAPGNQ